MGDTKLLTSQITHTGPLSFPVISENIADAPGDQLRPVDSELFIRTAFDAHVSEGMTLLFNRYYQPLCSHAVRFVSSKEIAEDIVSDLFYDIQSKELYQTITTSFRAFLFTAVRNRAFDHVRVEMHRNTSLEQAEPISMPVGQQPDTVTQFEELYQDVEAILNQLPVKRRQVYVMHRFEGRKYQEIAQELNLSLKTVEGHMTQAILQVRKALRAKWLTSVLLFCDYLLQV